MYSTIARCRFMVTKANTIAKIIDADITLAIVRADEKVREVLSKYVDVSLIPDTDPPTCAEYVTFLSESKTNEWVLVHLYGAKRSIEQVSDIQYWRREFMEKVEAIEEGAVALGDLALAAGIFSAPYKKNVTPALGHGKHAGHLDEAGLEATREKGTAQGPDD